MSPASFFANPAIIWGFTPRNTKRLSQRMVSAVSGLQPSRAAASAECSGVEQDTATRSPPTAFTAAWARAPPMLPAPMKPDSYFAIGVPPYRVCPLPRTMYL